MTDNHGLVPATYLSLIKQMIAPNSKDRPTAEHILEAKLLAQIKKDAPKNEEDEKNSEKRRPGEEFVYFDEIIV